MTKYEEFYKFQSRKNICIQQWQLLNKANPQAIFFILCGQDMIQSYLKRINNKCSVIPVDTML